VLKKKRDIINEWPIRHWRHRCQSWS